MMSCCASCSGRSVSVIAVAVDAPRQRLRAFQRAVGDGDVLGRARREMHRIEFDHLARADEQHVLFGDAREDALGQPDRGGGHRHQVRADLGLGAHVLGHRESALEQFVQQETQRAGLLGLAHRLLHLPEYLRLAQHHRIQAARHAERMLHRLFARQRVEIGLDVLARHLMILRQPVDGMVGICGVAIQLHAVAGGQDRRLFRRAVFHQVAQGILQPVRIERDLLAHVERRGLVVDAKGE